MPVLRHAVFVVLLATLAAAALFVGPASGATGSKTQVVVSLKTPAFHGSLKVAKAGCEVGRTVRLYRVGPGPDKVLKRSTSNREGRWSTPIRLHSGSYYAKAAARGGCGAGKSRILRIP
jgi:hypothetical protein